MYDTLTWFKAAETLTTLGDPEGARSYHQKIIAMEQGAALWGAQTPLAYFAALSLRALGQEMEANEKLKALQDFAKKKLETEDDGGFFTSKPAMIVFDDDPKVAHQLQGWFLMGLANLRLGNVPEAEANFSAVLSADPHHWWAQFMLKK